MIVTLADSLKSGLGLACALEQATKECIYILYQSALFDYITSQIPVHIMT